MKLGIIGAMDIEVATMKEKMENSVQTVIADMEFCEGSLRGLPAVVVKCGVGKVNAAMCAQALISNFAVTHLVNTGIAGSLSAALDIGDLVVSRDVMHHDFDCCHFGYAPGQVPGMSQAEFPADDALRQLAAQVAESIHPGHVRQGRVASGDQFVCSQEKKDAIIDTTHALCTEMEGAAIAQTAFRNGVPFVILRAISDKADDSAQMDYPTFEALAAQRCAAVAEGLAEKLAL